MKNQKGNIGLIVILIAVVLLAGGYYVYHKMTKQYMLEPTATTQSQNAIQNDSQLQSASTDLDNTNVDSMDTELNQNTQDASSF